MTVFHSLCEPDQVRVFVVGVLAVWPLVDLGMRQDTYGEAS